MSILKEIHEQPEPVRHAMFVLSVLIAVSVIGSIWLSSFQRDVFALMNSPEDYEKRFYAQGEPNPFAPAAVLANGVDVLKAGIYTVLGLGEDNMEKVSEPQVYRLPLSQDKF